MVNRSEVTCSNCDWKGKLILSHLRKNEKCQSKYDIASMEMERKEKNREATRSRKAKKAQMEAETIEKSGEIVQSCVNCNWKGKNLQKHLGKKILCSQKYYKDFEECKKKCSLLLLSIKVNLLISANSVILYFVPKETKQ